MPIDPNYKTIDEITDKRYFPRWEVYNRVLYQFEDQLDTFECQTKDLSCAGACILSRQNIPPPQKVKLIVYLSASKFVSLEGKVIWSHALDGQFELGVLFEDVSSKNQIGRASCRERVCQYV